MARMRVIAVNMWGEGGVQVNYQLVPLKERAYEVTFTEMAMPENAEEFARLMAIRLYEEFDVKAS
ncbi:hypothetical protein LCGC14_2231790 [marine sediment metagenome]|uniref:Uncharacterized protein n=1 Tax=marine sediment metagenome TaxID=412755 RepID=A0A0F9FKM6_9ZZZZ